MAIVISGVNNNDKITAADGTIDLLSGVNYAGIITAPAFTTPGNLTSGHLNVGSNIQLGNAGVATATTFVGNLTGNVNATSNLLLQIGGSEKFRVGSSGQLGIAGANYGTSGQVLTSGGSGSAATWTTVSGTTINNNADNRVITGSGTANTLEGEANLTFDGSTFTVSSGTSGDAKLIIEADSDNNNESDNPSIRFKQDGGVEVSAIGHGLLSGQQNGLVLANGVATGYIALATGTVDGHVNATERLRIKSDGKIGIGTNDPGKTLDVRGTGGNFVAEISNTGTAANNNGVLFSTTNAASSTVILTASSGGYERLRITGDGNLALGNTHAVKKFHISTTGNQKILIDPNYNNNSGGSSNTEANANNIVESILIRTSFGDNAASQTNAGHKWGIKFQGYNGNDFTQATAKCAGVFAVSEDEAGGYNRNVGLAFHTSPYNTAHREVMRINTNGAVTHPYLYVFIVETNGVSKSANWSQITGLSPDASQCTGVSNGTYWSNSTQRFTAPVTGVYHFFVGGWATSASNGSRYAYTFKHTNGNHYNYIGGGNYCLVDSPMDGFSRTIKLSAGEWVELWGFSSVSTTWGGGHRFFWGGYLLG